MIKRRLVAAIAVVVTIPACTTALKEERWRDTFQKPEQSWLKPGSYRLLAGRVLEVGQDRVTFRESRSELVIEAVEPMAVQASSLTGMVEGGQRYRIVGIECSSDYAACPMMKTNTEIYLTPLVTTRTSLVAGQRSRTFESVYISITGGSMRTQGPFERLTD
jgi:hypothetical protein